MRLLSFTRLCASGIIVLLICVVVSAQRPELVLQTGHASQISSAAFSSDAKLLATRGADGVKVWDIATGRMLRTFTPAQEIGSNAAFSSDDRSIAWGYKGEQKIEVRDLVRGEVKLNLAGTGVGGVLHIAFSADGGMIASANADRTVTLWDARKGVALRVIKGFPASVTAVAFSADGTRLTTTAEDSASRAAAQTISVWEVATGKTLKSFKSGAGLGPHALSRDGGTVAASSAPGAACATKVWDAASSGVARELQTCSTYPLALSRDGSVLAVATQKSVELWDARKGTLARKLEGISVAGAVSFSADAALVAAAEFSFERKASVTLFNAGSGARVRAFEAGYVPVYAAAFSPRGTTLALGAASRFRFWDGQNGVLPVPTQQPAKDVVAVAFSPDGGAVAVVSVDMSVRLLDGRTGAQLAALEGRANGFSVSFSPDGAQLAAGDAGTLRIWDARTGAPLRSPRVDGEQISRVAFSPDGKMLACAEGRTIKLRGALDGVALRSFDGHADMVSSVAFSFDGKMIASGSADKTLKLWDAAGGNLVRTLEGHAENVAFVAFSPDSRTVASGGFDKKVKLWDASSGKLLHTFEGYYFAFSPDGRLIAAGTDDGESSVGSKDASTRIYDAQTGKLLANLLMLSRENWIVVTPDGLFDGSPAAWNQVLWRYNRNTFDVAPIEWFFNELYYPGLLAELFAGKRPEAARDFAMLDRRQPKVKITTADGQTPPVVAARELKLKIEVANNFEGGDGRTGCGAYDLRLFRNGTLVEVWRGDVLKGKPSAMFEVTLPVVAGENNLLAYAFNRDNMKSLNAALAFRGDEQLRRKGTAHILAIGVNQYENAEFNLRYAVADAQDFAAEVKRQLELLGAYSSVEVTMLTDRDATKVKIGRALARLAVVVRPEDQVVVYFAGHGTAYRNQFHLLPHDLGYAGSRARLDEAGTRTIIARGVSDRELEAAFEKMDGGSFLLVIDACNSGQALEAEEKRRGPMNSKGLAQLAYEKGMYILTAAQSFQAALESRQLGHGLLTYALIEEGLKKSAADSAPRDGEVRAREWLDYATARVPEMQVDEMKRALARGLNLSFADEERSLNIASRSGQRPRVFYRRELEAQPFVVAKPGR